MLYVQGLLLATSVAGYAAKLDIVGEQVYRGMCDASAAVTVGKSFFIAGNDEDNVLRLYRVDGGGPPVAQYTMDAFLELEGKSTEVDIEGAAMIGTRAYWIGSHGRNRIGKERLNRSRLFATEIDADAALPRVIPSGKPYKQLLEDLFKDSRYNEYNLPAAAGLVPKERDALNIEGLASTPEGGLLIGFRNPIPKGRALIVPLLNPADAVSGRQVKFGAPITLDLGGLGIRDIVRLDSGYLIIGGPYDARQRSRLYLWSGKPTGLPKELKTSGMRRFNPEALVVQTATSLRDFLVLSDDGTVRRNGVECKMLRNPLMRQFRAFRVQTGE